MIRLLRRDPVLTKVAACDLDQIGTDHLAERWQRRDEWRRCDWPGQILDLETHVTHPHEHLDGTLRLPHEAVIRISRRQGAHNDGDSAL